MTRKYLKLRMVVVPLALTFMGAGTMIACRDIVSSGRSSGSKEQRAPSSGVLARLKASNPHDWVGAEHNAAIDAFRNELKKPGTHHNLCNTTAAVIARTPGALSRGASRSSLESAARVSLNSTSLCRSGSGSTPAIPRPAGFPASAPQQTSAALSQLLNEIIFAADVAPDLNDLAVRLEPISQAASGLEPSEQEILLATVSVALHSFEYWSYYQVPFEGEFIREYEDCARQYSDLGYSVYSARDACLNRGMTDSWSPTPSEGARIHLTTAPQKNECSLPYRFRRLIARDILGAIGGALGAAITGAGIPVGALAGAAAASVTEFIEGTWHLFWCAMQ